MGETINKPKIVQTGIARLTRYAVYTLILLPVVAVVLAYNIWNARPQASTAPAVEQAAATVISAKTLEERFGLRMTLIAVTAGGGIIDVRYKVLDKEKAAYLLEDPDNPPYLVVEGSGMTIEQAGRAMKHNAELKNNASYFVFYPNRQNAVQRGTPVAVAFGSVRVEPIVAQ